LIGVHGQGEAELAQVIRATGPIGLNLGIGQGRQEHAGKDGNNRNHYQQFDQCECAI
jgi:hypothetical protein